jgi:hypothetical protein
MVVALHVASGAALGALARSPRRALALGVGLHLLGDLVPHQDMRSQRFEIWSGVAALAALAAARGPLDPAVVGAAASCSPDLEHVVPLVRPFGRKLFHGWRWQRGRHGHGVSASVQLLGAGILVGLLLRPRGTP